MAAGNWVPFTINMTDVLMSGGIDLDSDNVVCVLLSASYTPSANTQSLWSSLSAYEVTGTGYTAGGQLLANKTVTHSGGTGTWDSDNVAWTTSTITAKYAALVRRAGASLVSGDLILAFVDLNTASGSATVSSTASTFTVTMAATGLIAFTANAS